MIAVNSAIISSARPITTASIVLNLKLTLFIVVLLSYFYVIIIALTYLYCNTYMIFYVVKFYTPKNILHNKTEKLQAAAI